VNDIVSQPRIAHRDGSSSACSLLQNLICGRNDLPRERYVGRWPCCADENPLTKLSLRNIPKNPECSSSSLNSTEPIPSVGSGGSFAISWMLLRHETLGSSRFPAG